LIGIRQWPHSIFFLWCISVCDRIDQWRDKKWTNAKFHSGQLNFLPSSDSQDMICFGNVVFSLFSFVQFDENASQPFGIRYHHKIFLNLGANLSYH